MLKLWIIVNLIALAFGSSCSSTRPGMSIAPSATQNPSIINHTITVFAAASLTGAFQEIGQEFEAANPGVDVSFNFAGSQILRTQLEQGAQADVFASADHTNMDLMLKENLSSPDRVHDFTTNSLIVILPAKNPGLIISLTDLARSKLKIILADASVPAGNYARQVLTNLSQNSEFGSDFSAKVLVNVVSNETDVKQVVTKIELGEADAGIVYTSDAVAAPELLTLPIPAKYNIVAHYPIAVLSNAPDTQLAEAFVDFVISTNGQAILHKWGFGSENP